MAVITAPAVVIGQRDAPWLAELLAADIEAGRLPPALAVRAERLISECQQVVSGGRDRLEPLLTYGQAASVLSVSRSTMRRLVAAGRIEPLRIGAAVRLRRSDVEKLAS